MFNPILSTPDQLALPDASTSDTTDSLCAVVLAAGFGTRLRPLTELRPKPLCPIGDTTPLQMALDRLAKLGLIGPQCVAVNASHLADQIVDAVGEQAHLSVEPRPLGTGGAIGNLASWIAGRNVLVCNADAYLVGAVPPQLSATTADATRVRLLTVTDRQRPDFAGNQRFAGISYLPARFVNQLTNQPSDLYGQVWRGEDEAGRLTLIQHHNVFIDCGTPREYLAANLHTSNGKSVVGAGAIIHGRITRSVIWPGAVVQPDEHLVDAIRADNGVTVTVNGLPEPPTQLPESHPGDAAMGTNRPQ